MISEEQIRAIADTVTAYRVDESALAFLRSEYPDIHFTWCMDDDVADVAKPVATQAGPAGQAGFNLYLVDGRDHCLCMTNDPDVATGMVVAEVDDG